MLAIAGAVLGARALLPQGGQPGTGRPPVTGSAGTTPSLSTALTPVGATPTPVQESGGQWLVTRKYQMNAPVSGLVVNDPVGAVLVSGGGSGGVSVTATVSYRSAQPAITQRVSGGTLSLAYSSCTDCGVSFQVTVPRGASITINEGTGHVGLTGLAGGVDVAVHAGSVTATGLTGAEARFSDDVGGINVSFSAPPRQLTAQAQTGAIIVDVPSSADYRVSANTGMGALTVTVPQSSSATHVVTATTNIGAVTVGTG